MQQCFTTSGIETVAFFGLKQKISDAFLQEDLNILTPFPFKRALLCDESAPVCPVVWFFTCQNHFSREVTKVSGNAVSARGMRFAFSRRDVVR